MTTATTVIKHKTLQGSNTRRIVMGIVFLLMAALVLIIFIPSSNPDQITTFGMTPGGISEGVLGDWVVKTQFTLYLIFAICAGLGVYQLVRGFGKVTNAVLAIVCLLFIFAFLTDAAAGKGMNLTGMLRSTILLSVPIILAAFSGMLAERGGVINIGIEGMMLMGAMVGPCR